MVVHESAQYIVVANLHRHHSSQILLVLFPLRHHPARAGGLKSSTWTASRTWFGHPAVGVPGGDIPLVGGRLRLLLRTPHARFALRGGPLVPPWPEGLLAEAVVGHLLLVGVGVSRFHNLGTPLKHRGRLN